MNISNQLPKALVLTALLTLMTAQAAPAEYLPGEYAFRTTLKNTFLSARPGNHSIDAVITSALWAGSQYKFRLERMRPNYTLIKTSSNYFVSAANGGGRGGNYDAATTLQTEQTSPADDALFRLQFQSSTSTYTIQTYRGYYLTALGGTIPNPQAGTDQGYNVNFELVPLI